MFSLIFILLIITLAGYVLTRTITKEKDSFILLPVSQIIGATFYIFLLNIVSKIFHGRTGIIISTLGLIVISLITYIKYRSSWPKLTPLSPSNKIVVPLIILTILALSILKMFNIMPAADSSMQWAYAANFARGNYPIMTSWQPDLTPNYHLGAYFLEGALFSLTGSSFLLIHTVFNTFLLLSGSLMVIFLIWKRQGVFTKWWAIISVLIFFISYGVITIALPLFSSQPQLVDLLNLRSVIPAKGEAEAALVNLNSLSFLPARSFSISLGLLALYILITPFKNKVFKIISLSVLLSVSALAEESMFVPLIVTITGIFIFSLLSFIPRLKYIAGSRKLLIIVLVLTGIMVLFQGGFITDNLLRTKREIPAFRIINPLSDVIFAGRIDIFKDVYIRSNLPVPFSVWFIPSPLWFILAFLTYSYVKKDPVIGVLVLFATSAFAVYMFTDYKYCSGCSIRIHSFGVIALSLGFILMVIDLLKNSSQKKNLIFLSLFVFFILIPTTTSDLAYQFTLVKQAIKDHTSRVIMAPLDSIQERMAKWAEDNIPPNERIIIIDIGFPSPGQTLNFQYHGLYTILGPQYTRVNRQEPGPEFYDLALTLNPSIFEKTHNSYVYIESSSLAYKQLPEMRKQDLNNPQFFQLLKYYEDNTSSYKLLKVLPLYFDKNIGGKEINEGRLDQLVSLIPKEASIYLSDYGETPKYLDFWYRLPMAYIFSDGNHNLFMNISQTTYQVIEMTLIRKSAEEGKIYDYYILPALEKPTFKAELIWSNIFASVWKRT